MSQPSMFPGVIAPMLTPFDANFKPDVGRFVQLAKRLLAEGCTGLAPFGTTGEALSLGLNERKYLLDALIAGGIPPSRLLVGTGLCNLPDTCELTQHARAHGCAGVMVLPPFYYKNVSDCGIFDYFAQLIAQAGGPAIYLYHIPSQAGIGFSIDLIGRLLDAFAEQIVGLKDSSGDWGNTHALLQAFPRLRIFCGSEVFLLDTVRNGGAGCITAGANVNAAAIRDVFDQSNAADAVARQAALTAQRRLLEQQPLIPVLKQILAHRLDDSAWTRVRPPLSAISAEGIDAIVAELNQLQLQ